MFAKLKEYAVHFLASCLIILIAAGVIKYHNDVRNLNEQIYLAGKAHGPLIFAAAPKKSLIDTVLGKKQLHVSPDIPKENISKVIEVHTSTSCPPVNITLLKSGNVVSDSAHVTKILVEDYENTVLAYKLDLRLASMIYPRLQGRSLDWDLGLQISYIRVWKLYPDVTVAPDFIGVGVSYSPGIKHLEGLLFGIGYGYRWDDHYYTPYASGSLRFGK